MLDNFLLLLKDAWSGIDRAFIASQMELALSALPFDIRTALAYIVVTLGAYLFIYYGYRFITEPSYRFHQHLVANNDRHLFDAIQNMAPSVTLHPSVDFNSIISTHSLSPRRRRHSEKKTSGFRFDFVVVSHDGSILGAVDYRSLGLFRPSSVKRAMRLKKNICLSAQIPYVLIDRRKPYKPSELSKILQEVVPIASEHTA